MTDHTRHFTLFPQHWLLRRLALLWLAVAVVVLVAMLMRPELDMDQRRAFSTLVPLYFLSLPLGHAGLVACNKLKLALYLESGFEPALFTEGMLLWLSLAVLGYLQWFVLLPWLSAKARQLNRVLFVRKSAR